LLSIGALGIMVEIFSPGLIFPGIAGAISLLLAFYSLGMLSVNFTGVLLILLAFLLFIAEAFTASFGILLVGGIISLIIGSLILFKGNSVVFRIDPWLIAVISIIFAGLFGFVINRVIKAHRRQAGTGQEELVGKTAEVRTPLNPEGTVFVEGELWSAAAEDGKIERGEAVTITKVEGLKLRVTRKA
ncbi:MAG: NfeD family protein, partial [Dehalococcoidales bacterium]|nr:NfeD family protein [Dehalococcoidales bacterium]